MESYRNLKILQNLYRLQSLGFEYSDMIQPSCTSHAMANDIDSLKKEIQSCCLCDFSKSATQSMSGYGSSDADILFLDYSVSELEDLHNSYYCGRSGEILKNMIQNVLGLSIEEVFFTHAIKCKPLSFQKKYPTQFQSCQGYLRSQIKLIKPKVVVALGEESYNALFPDGAPFKDIRGHILEYDSIKVVAIYHPSYILRNPNLKKIAFYDLKTIKSCL